MGGKIPILIDGSFRRGSDVLKAIALGANAVLLGRPAVWGLAAYGAEGVQAVDRVDPDRIRARHGDVRQGQPEGGGSNRGPDS